MTTQTEVKNHSCNQCGKSFNQRSNLGTHMTTDTGVKNHSEINMDYCDPLGDEKLRNVDVLSM